MRWGEGKELWDFIESFQVEPNLHCVVVETGYDSVSSGPLIRESLYEGANEGLEEERILVARVLEREEVLCTEDGERAALLEGVSQEADVVEETAQGPDVRSAVDRLVRVHV